MPGFINAGICSCNLCGITIKKQTGFVFETKILCDNCIEVEASYKGKVIDEACQFTKQEIEWGEGFHTDSKGFQHTLKTMPLEYLNNCITKRKGVYNIQPFLNEISNREKIPQDAVPYNPF